MYQIFRKTETQYIFTYYSTYLYYLSCIQGTLFLEAFPSIKSDLVSKTKLIPGWNVNFQFDSQLNRNLSLIDRVIKIRSATGVDINFIFYAGWVSICFPIITILLLVANFSDI